MDWPNERYVRLYTRDTPEWLCLPWQSRALWPNLLRKLDRAGVLATKLGAKGIAVLVSLPLEIVEPGLAGLLDDGCLEPHDLGYVAPNFLPAQEAAQTDAHRSREYRARRRGITKRDGNVTKRGETVTEHHDASQAVTPSLAVPSRTKPNQEENKNASPSAPSRISKKKGGRKEVTYSAEELATVTLVLSKLSDRNGCAYQASAKHTALVVSRLRAGYSAWDMRRVIAYCADELGWQDKPDMKAYLRPETLFGPEAMERYVYAARVWMPGDAPKEDSNVIPLPLPDRRDGDLSGPAFTEPSWMSGG